MHIYRFQFSGQPSEVLVIAHSLHEAQAKVRKSGEKREPASIQRLSAQKVLS